jgi:hypothetical protein
MRPIMERNLPSRFFTKASTAACPRRALEAAGGINRRHGEQMMMTSKTTIRALIGAVLAAGALGASAQHVERGVYQHDDRYEDRYDDRDGRYPGRTAMPRIERVMAEQADRIRYGLRTGRLTRDEAFQLRRQQRNIAQTRQTALADGHASDVERRFLRNLQARAEVDIERALRNGRHYDGRYGYGYGNG